MVPSYSMSTHSKALLLQWHTEDMTFHLVRTGTLRTRHDGSKSHMCVTCDIDTQTYCSQKALVCKGKSLV